MNHLRNEETDRLVDAILHLENAEECYAFLTDLCTVKEIHSMAQRFQTARKLDQGESYLEICENVGVSTATISRVNRALIYGEGGYRSAIDKMKASEKDNNGNQ